MGLLDYIAEQLPKPRAAEVEKVRRSSKSSAVANRDTSTGYLVRATRSCRVYARSVACLTQSRRPLG